MPISRTDPYGSYNFKVEIKGIITAGFSEVSGLGLEIELETVREGGLNERVHKLLKGATYTDITLKRGLVDLELWDWYWEVVGGEIQQKDMSILLCDNSGDAFISWDYHNALPIKWEGPTLNSSSSTVATETLVLTHEGLLSVRKEQ